MVNIIFLLVKNAVRFTLSKSDTSRYAIKRDDDRSVACASCELFRARGKYRVVFEMFDMLVAAARPLENPIQAGIRESIARRPGD